MGQILANKDGSAVVLEKVRVTRGLSPGWHWQWDVAHEGVEVLRRWGWTHETENCGDFRRGGAGGVGGGGRRNGGKDAAGAGGDGKGGDNKGIHRRC